MDLATARQQCIDPSFYQSDGYPHEAWSYLRRNAPVTWCEAPGFRPFWAIAKHADIVQLSKHPDRFQNAPIMALFPLGHYEPETFPVHHLINMDPPEHRAYRNLVSAHFTPRAIESKRAAVERVVDDLLDGIGDGEIEFVNEVSAVMPIAVIAEMLGIPESDRAQFFHWTNQSIAPEDPEYAEGASAAEASEGAIRAQFEYFDQMARERRRRPRNDLVSLLVNARIDGKPLPEFEFLSYLVLLIVAGNETTRNGATGGLLALIENPDSFARLHAEPRLVRSAVEEVVRWTTPVNQFCRTPVEDFELRGQKIRAGEPMCLFYASANRDEEVFDAPFEFRVDRWPNRHLGFGIGEHVCLGAHLARMELQIVFDRLVRRFEGAELAGAVERQRSSFVGGIKRMPVRLHARR